VLATAPAVWIWEEARRRKAPDAPGRRGHPPGVRALSIRENYVSYFTRFKREQEIILEPVLDMVNVMRAFGAKGVPFDNVYLLNRDNWVDGRCIAFEIGDLGWYEAHDVPPRRPVPFIRDRPLLFFFHRHDTDRRAQLRTDFPDGQELVMEQPHLTGLLAHAR
jgi:hypothetical protein